MTSSADYDQGVILLEYNDDFWVSICYDGDIHQWDKRSVIVACRQLGYNGGWPIMIEGDSDRTEMHLQDFECGRK